MKITFILLFILAYVFTSCHSANKNESVKDSGFSEPAQPAAPVSTEVVIFSNDTSRMPQAGGFGYIIKVDGNPYIFQPTIPAISGNKGFQSAEDAAKTADLVAYKLRNNINPPSVTVAELDSLGIRK